VRTPRPVPACPLHTKHCDFGFFNQIIFHGLPASAKTIFEPYPAAARIGNAKTSLFALSLPFKTYCSLLLKPADSNYNYPTDKKQFISF